VVLDALAERGGSWPWSRLLPVAGLVARDTAEIANALGLDGGLISGETSRSRRHARMDTRAVTMDAQRVTTRAQPKLASEIIGPALIAIRIVALPHIIYTYLGHSESSVIAPN
jgi:hypothetical protein